jgi:chromosome segregation ATPase
MLEVRVGRLEEDVREIKADIRELRRDLGDVKDRLSRMEVGIGRIEAKLESLPNIWHFALGLIGTVAAVLAVTLGLR